MAAVGGGDTLPTAPVDSGGQSPARLTRPDQTYSGAVKTAGVVSGGNHQIPNMRSFHQIIEDEKKNRNILEIHITKADVLGERPDDQAQEPHF